MNHICKPWDRGDSDPEGATESSVGIVRLGAVMIDEYMVVSAVSEDGTARFSDRKRCFQPA